MGKIYRLSNGGLVTVMVDDEANFFNILKEKNLTAELVNDPNTEYDNVPSYKASLSSDNTQEDPTVEVDTGIGIVYRKMELIALSFLLFFSSTYCCSTVFLHHNAHLHKKKF